MGWIYVRLYSLYVHWDHNWGCCELRVDVYWRWNVLIKYSRFVPSNTHCLYASFHAGHILLCHVRCSLLCRELYTHCREITCTANCTNLEYIHVCSCVHIWLQQPRKIINVYIHVHRYLHTSGVNVRTYFSSKVNSFVYDYTGTPTHECFCGVLWLCCVAEGVFVCTRLVHTRSIKGVPLLLHCVHVHVVYVCTVCASYHGLRMLAQQSVLDL